MKRIVGYNEKQEAIVVDDHDEALLISPNLALNAKVADIAGAINEIKAFQRAVAVRLAIPTRTS